jgi:parallel beta-helix repeat protein
MNVMKKFYKQIFFGAKSISAGKIRNVFVFIALFIAVISSATAQITYYWIGGAGPTADTGSGKWSLTVGGASAGSITPSAANIFIIDGSDIGGGATGAVTMTFSTNRAMGQLILQNNAELTVQTSSTTPYTLTIGNSTSAASLVGHDLRVDAGCKLTIGAVSRPLNVTLQSTSNATKHTFYNAGWVNVFNGRTLTISQTGVVHDVAATGTMEFDGNAAFATGTLTYANNANLLYSGSTAKTVGNEWQTNMNAIVTINNSGGITHTSNQTFTGSLSINSGAILKKSSGTTLTNNGSIINDGTFEFIGSAALSGTGTLTYNSGSSLLYSSSIAKVAGTECPATIPNGVSLKTSNTAGLTLGNVTIESGGIFEVINAAPVTVSGELIYNNGSKLLYSGSTDKTVSAEWPTVMGGDVEIANQGTNGVTIGAGVTKTIETGNTLTIVTSNTRKLRLSGTLVMKGTLINNGLLTVASGGILQMHDNASYSNIAPVYSSGGRLMYSGTVAKTTGPEFLASMVSGVTLEINNTGGVTLNEQKTIAGILTLTNGVLNTTASNLLIISNTTAAAIVGGDSSSFVNGPLRRNFPSISIGTYRFPVGRSSFGLLDIILNGATGGTLVVQVEYFDTLSGGTAGSGLTEIGDNYWKVEKISGTGNVSAVFISLSNLEVIDDGSRVAYSSTVDGSYENRGGSVILSTVTSTFSGNGIGFFAIGTTDPLNGLYSVGEPASDFPTINEAINAAYARGVTGQVIFEIASGTYNQQILMNGIIPGASNTNTVTFRGQAGTELSFNTQSATRSVIVVNGAKYLRFENLTVITTPSATTSYGWGFNILSNSEDIHIKNCNISIGSTATSTTYSPAGIVISGSTTSATTGAANVNNILIENNTINGGYYGISAYGPTTGDRIQGLNISGNTILNSYLYGAYIWYTSQPVIYNNLIDLRVTGGTTAAYNIDFRNNDGPFDISNNILINPGSYGLYILNSGAPSGSPSRIVNNSIGGGFRNTSTTSNSWALYITTTANIDIFYNSINFDGPQTTTYGAAIYTTSTATGLDVKNNSFSHSGTGTAYAAYFLTTPANFTAFDYNNFYTPTSNFVYYNTANRTDLAALKTAGTSFGHNQNSVSGNPDYTSSTYLLPNVLGSQLLMNVATPISGIDKDIVGVVRDPVTPDIGAYEFKPQGKDAGVDEIIAPVQVALSGVPVAVYANIRNFGADDLVSADVCFSVNGGTAVCTTWTGLLTQFEIDGPLYIGDANFDAGFNTLKVWTSSPNGGNDANNSNDTITVTIEGCPVIMNGTYTVGSTPGNDFATITDAVNELYVCGINGPVVFELDAQTFNERLIITDVLGTSALNTITFRGQPGTEIYHATGSANAWRSAIYVDGAKHIHFENLAVTSMGVSSSFYAWGIHISSNSNNIKIENCNITVYSGTSTNQSGIVISGSTTSATTGASNVSDILVKNNTINGGYYGVSAYGLAGNLISGLTITGNTILNSYYYGLYIYYASQPVIHNNLVDIRVTGGTTVSYGMDFSNNDGPFEITNNIFMNAGAYGLYISGSNATSGNSSLIANNSIGGGFRQPSTSYSRAFYITTSSNINIYYNSINFDGPQTSTYGAAFYTLSSATGLDVRNNSFAHTGSSTAYAAYFGTTPVNFTALDYNNYYSPTSSFVYYNGANRTDLAALQAQGAPNGHDQNSVSGDPEYTSPTYLLPNVLGSQLLMNAATPVSGFDTDIVGVVRDPATPDIGAYEFKPQGKDAGVAEIIAPVQVALSGVPVAVYANIRNFGADDLVSANVCFSVNGGTAVCTSWTGLLTQFEIDGPVYIGDANFDAGFNTLKVWTSSPNGGNDANNSNDTITVIIEGCPVIMNGTYTVGSTPGNDFATITDAVNELYVCGINGPVVFELDAETFNERLIITDVLGSSALNTITFRGQPGTEVSFNTLSSTRSIFVVDGAKHLRFEDLRVITTPSTTTGYGWGFNVLSNSHDIQISNCQIDILSTATSTTYSPAAIVISGSTTSATTGAENVSDILIQNNIINGGYYGVSAYGLTTGNRISGLNISGNTILNSYYYGMYIYYTSEPIIHNNSIDIRVAGGTTAAYGIDFQNNDGPFQMTNNSLINSGAYGFYIVNSSATPAQPSLIANNSIGGGFRTTSTSYGLYITTSTDIDIFYNSILNDAGGTTSRAIHTTSTATGLDVRNNTFAHIGSGDSYVAYFQTTDANFKALDYNNYYSSTSLFVYHPNTGRTDLAAWQSVYPALNQNSIQGDPEHLSATNLLPDYSGSQHLMSKGTPIAAIPEDILGKPRDVSTPDIGAYEFKVKNDAGISQITNPMGSDLATQTVPLNVVLKNYGLHVLTTVDIYYSLNGAAAAGPYAWTGNLTTNDETASIYLGDILLNFNDNTLAVWTENPNGSFDENNQNDTTDVMVVGCPDLPQPVAADTSISCGDEAILTASGSPAEYTWFADAAATVVIGTGPQFVSDPLNTDTIFYVASTSNGVICVSQLLPVTVTIIPLSNPVVSDLTINCGETATLIASGSESGEYTWFADSTGTLIIGTDAAFVSAPLNADTIYYVASTAGTQVDKLFMTEICHYKHTVGDPIGGWPSYLLADDYIEITGVPGFDIAGYTLEQWDGSSMLSTHTFSSGTVLSPLGTAVIAVGQMGSSVESPSNYYYHGNGGYASSFGSGTGAGRILKDPFGQIIDAVAYPDYSFPVQSGVTPDDWSGTIPSASSTSGIRLIGPYTKDATNWVVSSTSYRQNPNDVNSGVEVPVASAFCSSGIVPVSVTVTPLSDPLVSDQTINCGETATIIASGSPSGEYTWFADALATMPVDTGAQFVSDPLAGDTVFYVASTSGFTYDKFFMTEICHYRGGSVGNPSGGWPSYLTADDYIEITGAPGSSLEDFVFEIWDASGLIYSVVLGNHFVLSPVGTCIIATQGTVSESPANFYYHSGYTAGTSSTTVRGYILKNPNGDMIDAVVYGSMTFPSAAGVTTSDWSGTTTAGNAGIRLEGPYTKDATNWINSSVSPQNPNTVNFGVEVPFATAFCMSNLVQVNVTVLPLTEPVAPPSLTVTCGDTSLITASGAPAGADYEWYSDAAGTIVVGTGSQFITGALTADTTLYVAVVSGGICSSTLASVTITVDDIPNPTASDVYINPGETATLTATGSPDHPDGYIWYADPTGTIEIGTGSVYTTPVLNNTTTFYVQSIVTPQGLSGDVFEFSNCGAIGKDGPTQTQVDTEYSGTNLDGQVTVVNGIQYWTVPTTGTYKIEAWGAQGSSATGTTGGLGAYMSGDFELTQGEVVRVLVGQNAPNTPGRENLSSSGGGGSFVVRDPYNTNASILVIAGGGGGTGNERPATSNASITTAGQTGSHGSGGIDGNGGTSGIETAGAGGGFFTDGGGTSGAEGNAWLNGGSGGDINSLYSINGGGFGGGGSVTAGGNSRYGGGGGYSGGSGSSSQSGATTGLWGGGGGSYNSGLNQDNQAGIRYGHGLVVITAPMLAPCLSDIVPVTVYVQSGPANVTATASPNPLCEGETLTLTGDADRCHRLELDRPQRIYIHRSESCHYQCDHSSIRSLYIDCQQFRRFSTCSANGLCDCQSIATGHFSRQYHLRRRNRTINLYCRCRHRSIYIGHQWCHL